MEITKKNIIIQIRKAKEGSQIAFNFLLDYYWNDVYRFQLKRVQNEYEAEDITIESFSKAFDKMYEHHRNVSADLTQLLPGVRGPFSNETSPVPCSTEQPGPFD